MAELPPDIDQGMFHCLGQKGKGVNVRGGFAIGRECVPA